MKSEITGLDMSRRLGLMRCPHNSFVKIKHWWYNFECESCLKKIKRLPKGDYYTPKFK